MRIVLDTNVLISGIFFGGPPSEILQFWAQSKIKIILSKQILSEYQRVAEKLSAKHPSVDIEPIIRLFTIFGEFVDTKGINGMATQDLMEALQVSRTALECNTVDEMTFSNLNPFITK